jgi:hypothetical protein
MGNTSMIREGGCLCGRVRFKAGGEPVTKAICHCPSCRRASGAPAVAWAMYPMDQVRFSAGSLDRYESSPGAVRGFCGHCGTTLSFEGELIEGLIDVTIASFDDPVELAPDIHVWHRHRLPWVAVEDGAVTFDELPQEAPG